MNTPVWLTILKIQLRKRAALSGIQPGRTAFSVLYEKDKTRKSNALPCSCHIHLPRSSISSIYFCREIPPYLAAKSSTVHLGDRPRNSITAPNLSRFSSNNKLSWRICFGVSALINIATPPSKYLPLSSRRRMLSGTSAHSISNEANPHSTYKLSGFGRLGDISIKPSAVKGVKCSSFFTCLASCN